MKKAFLLAAILAALTSCERLALPGTDTPDSPSSQSQTKPFTFTLKGDFTLTGFFTRASSQYMQADGKELTDLWILDIMDGEVIQEKHLTPSDDEWGAPHLNLKYGTHQIKFLASRGTGAQKTDAVVTWQKTLDTFYKNYEVTVVSTSNGNRAVTLDRIATALVLTLDDAVPQGITSVSILPSLKYGGINLLTDELVPSSEPTTFAFSSQQTGISGIALNAYWLALSEEYTTDITVTAYKDADTYTSVTIPDAPFRANRKTTYHGTLFSSTSSSSLTLNAEWLSTYEGGNW